MRQGLLSTGPRGMKGEWGSVGGLNIPGTSPRYTNSREKDLRGLATLCGTHSRHRKREPQVAFLIADPRASRPKGIPHPAPDNAVHGV